MSFEAVKAMFPPEVRVYLLTSELSNPPALSDYPHVVIWGTIPTKHSGAGFDDPNLSNKPDALRAELRFTYAATSYSSLKWLLDRARPAIDRKAPVIEGYHVEVLEPRSLMPMETDRDIRIEGRNPVFATDEATLIASRI